jgi:endonuclease/exonuclease/phosphatase family metal-dependent hydrolase
MNKSAVSRGAASTLLLALLAVTGSSPAAPPDAPPGTTAIRSLALVGRTLLPRNLEADGTRVGGLSGLAWDEASGSLWAVSDDRGQHGPVRLYRLILEVAAPNGNGAAAEATVSVRVERALPLSDAEGRPFSASSIDTEGIAALPDGFLVSTEPILHRGVAAVIAEFGLDGRQRASLRLPDALLPGAGHGGRENLGFEGLALTPDGKHLFAALENALEQDGPVADAGVTSPSRILRFDRAAGGRPSEFVYVVEPVHPAPPSPGGYRMNGLSDLLPIDEHRLLSLERQFVDGVGNAVRIWEVSLEGATDVAGADSLVGLSAVLAKKRLLFDLADFGIRPENFEGMSLGPRLPDGRRTLVLVSDDNFNPQQDPTTFVVFAFDDSPVPVARLQGRGHRSPYEGGLVFGVPGVVTAVDRDTRAPGFYLESARPDGDPSTSEGVFVAWADASSLAPGRAVAVSGKVEEASFPKSLTVTRVKATAVVAIDGEPPLPPPAKPFERPLPSRIDDDALSHFEPSTDAVDFWESLEGMRVELPAGTVVGPSSSRGDLTLRPDGAPAVPRTAAGGVLLPEAGPSLDRALLSRRLAGWMPAADVGARLAGPIAGVVDYSFSNYRIYPFASPVLETPGRGCAATTSLAGDEKHLTVATFNVENLSVAGPRERFAALGEVLAKRMGGPDVVALQEVQDDSGPEGKGDEVVTSRRTLSALVAAVISAGGPRYEPVWIDPVEGREGGQPGGNIRVALLLNRARVTLVHRGEAGPLDETHPERSGRKLRLSLSPGRVAPRSPAFTLEEGEGVRRSLAAELKFGGRTVFVVANHLSSKSDDDRAFGAPQPPRTPTLPRRLAQAREVRAFVEKLLAADPKAAIVVLGDLNDFEHSEPVRVLGAPPLENLVLRVPPESRYTFNFEGASQVLDHVVVSSALAEGASVEVVHVNSDCSDRKRSSDHDPVVTRLRLK